MANAPPLNEELIHRHPDVVLSGPVGEDGLKRAFPGRWKVTVRPKRADRLISSLPGVGLVDAFPNGATRIRKLLLRPDKHA